MQEEIWKDVLGYEGLYCISNFGRVKKNKPHNSDYIEKIIKYFLFNGYKRIRLTKDKISKTYKVHRLVIATFKGQSNLACNHKDCNKLNNHIDNLEYVTNKENSKHAVMNGLYKYHPKGENHCRSKFKEKDILEIRRIYSEGNITQKNIAEMFNVKETAIWNIIHNITWKHVR